MKLRNAFKSLFSGDKDPKVKCKIDGFELSLSKEEKEILKEKGTEKCLNETEHYVVSVRPNGANAEYPAEDNESKFRFVKLKEEAGSAYGMSNGVCFIPHDAKWTGFELSEEFQRGKDFSGQQPADHHSVAIQAHFKKADGQSASMGIGSSHWVRKTDLESEEWAAAKRRNRNREFM